MASMQDQFILIPLQNSSRFARLTSIVKRWNASNGVLPHSSNVVLIIYYNPWIIFKFKCSPKLLSFTSQYLVILYKNRKFKLYVLQSSGLPTQMCSTISTQCSKQNHNIHPLIILALLNSLHFSAQNWSIQL